MKKVQSWLIGFVSSVLIVGTSFGQEQSNLRENITGSGLLQVIEEGDDIFRVDPQARGVQFRRESDWKVFFDEALS